MRRTASFLLAALLAGTCSAPPSAIAAITPEARAVLERYDEAIGAKGLPAERSLHMKHVLEAFGLRGTTESWAKEPDLHASATELGPFKLREGWDGTTAWKTDPSGQLVRLDGKDLEDARSSAWFEAEAWRLPNEGGGRIAVTGSEKDSAGEYVVLEMTPPVGKPRTFWFARKSGLLDRMISKSDQNVVVSRLSEWRKMAGRLRPTRLTTQVVGMPANTLVGTLETAEADVAIPDSTFAPPGGSELPARWLQTKGRATLPFDYRGRHVWLRVSVDGRPPADFLFDTGASITVLDSAYAARIGLKTEGMQEGQGAGATGRASFARLGRVRIESAQGDGVEVQDVKVAVLSVNGILGPYFWKDVAGVIGFDLIHRFVTTIDFDKSLMTIVDPDSFRAPPRGVTLPMTLANHVPVVSMTLDGKYRGDFRIDVGSNATVDLHGPFVRANGLDRPGGRSVEVTSGGFGGTFSNRLIRMKRIDLGPFSWKNPIVSLTRAETGAFASEDYAGNIGNRLLERFRVTFDYARRTVRLEPSARYREEDHLTRAGAQLARQDGVVRVMSVIPGSPAERVGIESGDEVVSLDGRPIAEVGPDGVREILDEGRLGSRHDLELRRDGVTRKVRLTLRDVL